MKTLLLVPTFLLCIIHPSQAQNDSIAPKKIYRIWVKPIEKRRLMEGALFDVKDSSILMSNSLKKKDYYQGDFHVLKVNARSINVVEIRKGGNPGKGALIGAATGLVLSSVAGLIISSKMHVAEGEREGDREVVVMLSSVALLGLGIGIGTAIGSAKINIPIKGSQTQFDHYKDRLKTYSLKYNSVLGSKSFSKLIDTVVDIDGNVYHTLALGGQVWMAENLKVTHFRDGSEISDATNNASGVGRQYNWFAVNHSMNLCPINWHVPSLAEWTSLLNSLGGEIRTGNKLEKDFSNKWKESQWWSSTEQDTLHAQSLYLNNETIGVMFASSVKTDRMSVRCIRDY